MGLPGTLVRSDIEPLYHPEVGGLLDLGLSGLVKSDFEAIRKRFDQAFLELRALEEGEIANQDEQRMVGHYWLRCPERAPSSELRDSINAAREEVVQFSKKILSAGEFESVLVIGIGGSALGPQFVYDALKGSGLKLFFSDNTDAEGLQDTLSTIVDLSKLLVLVISKSGGTKETRNGMLLVKEAFRESGLSFHENAVAITGEGSALAAIAGEEGWLASFPMWDWVGGRTSVMSAVGLLPAALQGADTEAFLDGAKKMDEWTRTDEFLRNPAALLAGAWCIYNEQYGVTNMVVLPYRDRLLLMSRYLQQLVMESIGKSHDRDGKPHFGGISVFGNKGSTDQHAFVQQLRDGRRDFHATLISALSAESNAGRFVGLTNYEVEKGVTADDYLNGFCLGTRQALFDAARPSLLLQFDCLNAHSLGAAIALYERAVSLYATLVNVNAYHQPGVEAGKKAAGEVVALQKRVEGFFAENAGKGFTVTEVARGLDLDSSDSYLFYVLRHLSHTGRLTEKQSQAVTEWSFSS